MGNPMQRRSPRLLAKKLLRRKVKQEPRRYLPRRSQRIMEKKKKILTTHIRQRPTVLDSLPVNVIEYHIFPLLDYETRLNLNVCLPAWDRIRTKMSGESIKNHQTDYCVRMLNSMLRSLDETNSEGLIYTGEKRIKRMTRLLNLFHRDDYFYIYTQYPRFRAVFMNKIDEMEEAAKSRITLYSRECIDDLISVCSSLRNKILNYTGELRA